MAKKNVYTLVMQDKHLLPGEQQLAYAEVVRKRGWFGSTLKPGFPLPGIMVTHSSHGWKACKEYKQRTSLMQHLLLGPER